MMEGKYDLGFFLSLKDKVNLNWINDLGIIYFFI